MTRPDHSPWRRVVGCLAALPLLAACGLAPAPADDELMVFAAASLRDALLEQAAHFARLEGSAPSFNFAGSNVLALQLEAAPGAADVFVSADTSWMDRLESGGLVLEDSRVEFLSNRLVVVAHRDSGLRVERLADLAAPEVRYLALGNPEAVPAGRYARAALERVTLEDGSLWEAVAGRVAPAADVRGALALVESRPDTLGIVYATDAAGSSRVAVVLEIPASLTPPIRYSAAVLSDSPRRPPAAAFVRFLAGDEARRVFERHGFSPLAPVAAPASEGAARG